MKCFNLALYAAVVHARPANFSISVPSSGQCHLTQLLVGIDCPENDISHNAGSSVDDCCTQCQNINECTAFTYTKNTCWFKTSCGPSTTCDDCSVGLLRIPAQCKSKLSGIDCSGNDLSSQTALNFDECCDLCSQTNGCKAFTYRWNKCWFKTNCETQTQCSDCTAGLTASPAPPAPPPGPPFAEISGVYSTSDLKALLSPLDIPTQTSAVSDAEAILIDTRTKYQEIIGFGGAFTEASGLGFASLNSEDQKKIIDAYWAPVEEGGNGYTTGRVPMNSCDFSPKSYNFDNVDGDFELDHFDMNVTHDQQTMLPLMRAALARAPEGIKIFLSPWSPPGWMKGNGQMTHSSSPCLKASTDEMKHHSNHAWANYFSKFFTAYKNNGVPLWGLTVQNEPGYDANWEACTYTAAEERDFVKYYLGPVMRQDHPSAKIMVLDHNRDMVPDWTETIFGDSFAAKFVDGLAVHWYDSHSAQMYENLKNAHDQYLGTMGKFILGTEACNCPGVQLRDWGRAWSIAEDILKDLNAFAAGWTDWNLILDHQGGPNHLGNFCDANIIADPNQVLGSGTVIKQVSYYLMGHFSRYLRPGMVRVSSTTPFGLDVTAFHNVQTNKVAVVVMNGMATSIPFVLQDIATNTSKVGLTIGPNSIQTYIYSPVSSQAEVVV